MDHRETRNAHVMERLHAGFERHDVEAIIDCFTGDGVFDVTEGPEPWGERFQGKPSIRKALEALFSAIPDVQFVDGTRWVAGDRGVSEWTCVGTTTKGRPIRVRGCDLFEFREGLVARKDSYFKRVRRPPSP